MLKQLSCISSRFERFKFLKDKTIGSDKSSLVRNCANICQVVAKRSFLLFEEIQSASTQIFIWSCSLTLHLTAFCYNTVWRVKINFFFKIKVTLLLIWGQSIILHKKNWKIWISKKISKKLVALSTEMVRQGPQMVRLVHFFFLGSSR